MKQFIKKPWVQWSALFLFIAVILYFVYKPEIQAFFSSRKGKNDGSNKLAIDPVSGTTNPTLAAALSINVNKQLKRGDKGNEVVILQQLINEHGYLPKLSEDGIFGNLTLAAVQSLIGAPRTTVSIADFTKWKAKNLVSGLGATNGNGGINPNWWLSALIP